LKRLVARLRGERLNITAFLLQVYAKPQRRTPFLTKMALRRIFRATATGEML